MQFLKHVERCTALLYVVDVSLEDSWTYLSVLEQELLKFNPALSSRPAMVVANKIDLLNDHKNIELLKQHTEMPVIPISAKKGINLKELLIQIRTLYDNNKEQTD